MKVTVDKQHISDTPNIEVEPSILNTYVQNLLLALIPFYPIWAMLNVKILAKPIEFVMTVLLLPLALYFVVYVNKRLSSYLTCFILFTLYHLSSAFIYDTIPNDANKLYFILYDPNVLACVFLIIIDYTTFSDGFIKKMNKLLLWTVIISLVVSLIQIKVPTFFFNPHADEELIYIGENRNYSIYSWTNLNTAALSFPIFVSIVLNVYRNKKIVLPIAILSGIVVSFLTRTRYAMLSTIIVLSQVIFNSKTAITKRISYVFLLVVSLFFIVFVADKIGYNIQEVIDERILEKSSDMGSAKARVLSYEVFSKVFPENPILGVGPQTREDVLFLLAGEAPVIHVGYLCYLYYYGIVGSLFLFLCLFYMLRDAWIVGRKTEFWGSFYGIITFCLANWTLVYFNFSEMGILLAVIYVQYFKSKAELEDTPQEVEVVSSSFAQKQSSLVKTYNATSSTPPSSY